MSVDEIHELTQIDRWFLSAMVPVVDMHESLTRERFSRSTPTLLREAKRLGFSRLARSAS